MRSPIALSSIQLPAPRIGYEAARLLQRLMDHLPAEPPPPTDFPPIAVITRRSTEVLAVADQEVAGAMRFIRDHASALIGVDDIAAEVALARRSLEQRFRKATGHSPLQFLTHARIELAKRLLVETDLKMPTIARQSGFCDASHFGVVFRRLTGFTPTAYRERSRIT